VQALCDAVSGDSCASLAHLRKQVVPASQLGLHAPLQAMWQVEPEVHEMLPLGPSVAVQVARSQVTLPLAPVVSEHALPPLQFALQEPAQVPVQVFPSRQEREQLPPAALQPVAADAVQSQVAPGWQVQALPVQAQAGPGQAEALEESQATVDRTAARAKAKEMCRMRESPRVTTIVGPVRPLPHRFSAEA